METTQKIKGHKYTLCKLGPVDFLDQENGIPLTIFLIDQSKAKGQQIQDFINDESSESDTKQHYDTLRCVLGKGVLTKEGKPFDVDEFLNKETDFEACMELFNAVLSLSLYRFKDIIQLSKVQTEYFDAMAKRYGQLPIDCLFTDHNYSELDAFLFNSFILNYNLQKEASLIKKQNRKRQLARTKIRRR